jgi:BTB/POZ domain-containing protein KCTD9
MVMTINEKLTRYLDGLFAPYADSHPVTDLKEELLHDLEEQFRDLKNQGHDDETAYRMTIGSIGDISEMMESISAKTKELLQMVRRNYSASDLRNADLTGVAIHDGKFDASDLRGADFSGSDLTNGSFRWSDLISVRFDGANLSGAKFLTSDLRKASFTGCLLENTSFRGAVLSGVSFDNQAFTGTIFDNAELIGTTFRNAVFRNVSFKTDVKQAVFDGARMDKLTYVVLKGYGAHLTKVTVI